MKKAYLNPQQRFLDLPLLVVVSTLLIFGLVIVYDVSVIQAYRDFDDPNYYIRQQLIWAMLGLLAAAFFAYLPYQILRKFSFPFLAFSLILLLAVLIPGLGTEAGGARRWLNLGFLTIQPAEVFKFSAVLWLATIFEKGARLKPLFLLLFLASLVMGLWQRDLGSTVVFVVIGVIIYLVAGGAIWKVLVALPAVLAVLVTLILTSEYRKKRILAFLDPFSDTQGFSYHISQVLIALGSGGLFGLGFGQSRQKFYIPEVTTDSIFTIVGEELGLLGATFLVILFLSLIIRGFKIAQGAPDNFGKVLAAGLVSLIGVQAIINFGAMVALFPLTGVPLPFISYGGSALVANLAAVGILLNISRHNQ